MIILDSGIIAICTHAQTLAMGKNTTELMHRFTWMVKHSKLVSLTDIYSGLKCNV